MRDDAVRLEITELTQELVMPVERRVILREMAFSHREEEDTFTAENLVRFLAFEDAHLTHIDRFQVRMRELAEATDERAHFDPFFCEMRDRAAATDYLVIGVRAEDDDAFDRMFHGARNCDSLGAALAGMRDNMDEYDSSVP